VRSLHPLTATLLDSASDAESLDRASAELHALFRAAAAPAADAAEAIIDRRLDSGLALSPALAAKCLLDGRRTGAFLRGALQAIRDAVQRHAPEAVEVLYAGTGPFAPLAFLLMPFLDSQRVRFTLLDAHPESTQSVSALVDALGVADYVREVVCADATTYRHPSEVHVLISETMQRSLAEEPFVAILRNLRPQLAPGGGVVPERVTVDLALLDPATEQTRWNGVPHPPHPTASLGTVFAVDASREWTATAIDVPCDARWVALMTRIVVHQNEVLEPYASGLTTPEILWPLSPVARDLTLEFRYRDGSAPRIEWRERV
jgi:hypothetical protein